MPRRITSMRVAAAAALTLMFAVACATPTETPAMTGFDGSTAVLTRDATDQYVVVRHGNVTTVLGSSGNTGGNSRMLMWPAATASSDEASCATFRDTGGFAQEGVALRVRTRNGVTTAITVTKNVIFKLYWGFNVHIWNTSWSTPDKLLYQRDLRPVLLTSTGYVPYPWRLCAVVRGSTVSFKVWPTSHAEPAWNNTDYVSTYRLPAGWDYAGNPGWYIGHLQPAGSVTYTELGTAAL